MPEGNAQQPLKGLSNDTRPLEQPEGTYPYGKNGLQHDLEGAVRNEEGFVKMNAIVPYTFNGIIETDKYPIIFSTNNVDTAIGYFNTDFDRYDPIFTDANLTYKLGHKVDKWITGQAQRNYKGEMVVAFTDKATFPKYLNCDTPSVESLDDFNLFPLYSEATIDVSIQAGGRLPQGTYYVAAKYSKNDGTETGYSSVSRGRTVSGDGTSTLTNKAINIVATTTDASYDFITFAIISKINGVTSAVELDPLPLSAGDVTVTYTGDNNSIDISLEEILIPQAKYNKVQTMGQLNDALYLMGLEKEPDINDMQLYANDIILEWKSEIFDAISPPVEHISGEKKGFMHEEVVAFYVRYQKTKGGFTPAFHIPGIAPGGSDKNISTEGTAGGFSAMKYQVEDIIPTFNAVAKTGRMGVWENTTEHYPDKPEYGARADTKVCHHKFPSLRWCKEHLYASDAEYGKTRLDLLGIIASNITIPAKYTGVLSGYEILYAKRTVGNMTVVGQGQLLFGSVTKQDDPLSTGSVDIFTTGGNWNSSVFHAGAGSYNNNQDLVLRPNTFRFHAFDMLLNQPAVKADYISCQLKVHKDQLRLGFMEDGQDNDGNECATVHIVDYTTTSTAVLPNVGEKLRKVSNSFYTANGVDTNRFINSRHETAFAGTLGGSNWSMAFGDMRFYLPEFYHGDPDIESNTTQIEESFLVNMKVLKTNPYNGFLAQTLISAGSPQLITSNIPLFGGDVYISDYSFHTYGRHSGDDFNSITPPDRGKKVVRRFVCESVSNIHLRYEIPGNQYSKWYPKTNIQKQNSDNDYLLRFDRNIDPNQFGYNKDLNAVNDLTSATIYSPFKEYLTKFPFRIHRGGKLSRQSKVRSWRTFLPLDYYEMQKNMGAAVHLEGMDDQLLIHMENALFRTQDKTKLESGLLSVTLGAGDIFQFEPQEAQSAKLGYAGTQHELACVRTPIGYVFVDAAQGEIFLYKEKLTSFSPGIKRFLQRYLNTPATNPFLGNGITIGWDQNYKRILLTVKNKATLIPQNVKTFVDDINFLNTLQPGDTVLYKGRYIVYEGFDVIPPLPCVETTIEATTLPNAIAGESYSAVIMLSGSQPFTFTLLNKPTWMTMVLDTDHVLCTGIPDSGDVAVGIDVRFTVDNCAASLKTFYQTIDVIQEGVEFDLTTFVSGDSLNAVEIANLINGEPGAVVTITMDQYTNINGGTLNVEGSPAFLGNTWDVTLDGTGKGNLHVAIHGLNVHSTIIRGRFTITSVSAGIIGTPNSYQISKFFT